MPLFYYTLIIMLSLTAKKSRTKSGFQARYISCLSVFFILSLPLQILYADFGNNGDQMHAIAKLSDRNPETRVAAVRILGAFGASQVVEPLIESLQDEVEEVRLAAAAALTDLGDRRAVMPLLAALREILAFEESLRIFRRWCRFSSSECPQVELRHWKLKQTIVRGLGTFEDPPGRTHDK